MFDSASTTTSPLDASGVQSFADTLRTAGPGLDDAARIDLIRALEELACTAAAVQASVTADFAASQRAEQAARGVPAARQGRGIAAQIALARRESPHRGQQHVGLAVVLRDELPHTMDAFRQGRITEWKATLVARETACLSLADRRAVDARVAGDPQRIEAMGDRELHGELTRLVCELDPASVVARRRRAEGERRVTLRPAPDVMGQLSALLPVKDGVSVIAALGREADRLRAAGDPRSRCQVMADTLVQRVLSDPVGASAAPQVVLNLVVSDDVLFGRRPGAAELEGFGPVPIDLVRELADGERVWLRRIYASPATGALVALDSRARIFPRALARLLRLRDRFCRNSWCGAPIRHSDHVVAVDDDGATCVVNGQGLCEACNHAKQAPGWRARPVPGIRHTIETVTPTGHRYRTTAPPARAPAWVSSGPGRWVLAA
jgi:hypothetical protein